MDYKPIKALIDSDANNARRTVDEVVAWANTPSVTQQVPRPRDDLYIQAEFDMGRIDAIPPYTYDEVQVSPAEAAGLAPLTAEVVKRLRTVKYAAEREA